MKYDLVGIDGNAYSVMGYVTNALKQEGLGKLKDEYIKDATSSDYNHLLAVSIHYVDLANEEAIANGYEPDEDDYWEDEDDYWEDWDEEDY